MRLVLGTDVMVAAIRSDAGASRRLFVAILQGACTLLLSVPLIIEYEAVMTRPEHLAAARLSTPDVEALLNAVVGVAARGDLRKALGILKRAGVGNPPMKGDKLPTK